MVERPIPADREAVAGMLRAVDVFEPDQRKFSRPAMMLFAALLYDDAAGLLASALDAERRGLSLAAAPRLLRRGGARLWDVLTRYER